MLFLGQTDVSKILKSICFEDSGSDSKVPVLDASCARLSTTNADETVQRLIVRGVTAMVDIAIDTANAPQFGSQNFQTFGFVLPPSTALPVKEMEDIVAPRNEHLRMRSPIHQQSPLYRTYPDHREGLFPETVNQARYERPVANNPAHAAETITESKNWPGNQASTPMPVFRPYIGPERFTGSHLAREVYNIRHNGRPRFVKIDLLNE
ncbi:hypothetical protein Q1695_011809 [Nippostrongylus brasiliensis]|nr:hypothetical protein Q1695_011809 [Nippostrongylus brasiliensis]